MAPIATNLVKQLHAPPLVGIERRCITGAVLIEWAIHGDESSLKRCDRLAQPRRRNSSGTKSAFKEVHVLWNCLQPGHNGI